MVKRPKRRDPAILEAAAREWTEKNSALHPHLVGPSDGDKAWFAELLASAAERSSMTDSAEIAARLADAIHVPAGHDLLDAMDDFMAAHDRLYGKTLEQWAKGWGPSRPFEDFARIRADVGRSGVESGIGMIPDRYGRTARLLFLTDANRRQATREDGSISSWHVIQWEDVQEVQPATEEDVAAVTRHRQAEAAIKAAYATSRRKREAKLRLDEIVKSHEDMSMEKAMETYVRLAGTPEEAARIIQALNKAACRELYEAALPEQPEAPAPGKPA